ncbi:MAG: citrate lyase acyl carrier protein [Peptoniphilaceae bacterium]|nr:citrate lyase acyl carrier protein [Peptoniphilaceae bacterium]MDY6019546.1 citrate lyase acyl carrier protein [Anaerococcus sp.]
MQINNMATAGSLQSNDCFITIKPAKQIEIELESPVKFEFGDQIIELVKKTLRDKNIVGANVKIEDRGALDCTIEARLITAIRRSK